MLKQFSEYLQNLGKGQGTVKVYCQNVMQYLNWCKDSFGEQPTQLYRANVLEYISYMRNIKGYNPKTVNHHLSSLRSYNDWLIAPALSPRKMWKHFASACWRAAASGTMPS